MQVKEVFSKKEQKEFIDFPKRLYANHPDWICPLDKDIETVFDPNQNKFYDLGDARRWLLISEEKTIGRIAAFYKNESGKLSGGMGFFECVDKVNAAHLLFNTAEDWLRSKDCSYMDGPINFGEKDKYWGLLVAGFKNPSYQENFNFPYYQNLFESYGFVKNFEQTTSEIGIDEFKSERFFKLSSRVLANPAYRFEHFKMKELDKYAADFIHIYNKAWASRADFIAITKDKIESTLISLKPIMIEEAIWFAYANNEPAGFIVNVLDVNQIFKHLNGKMNIWSKLKFLYLRHFGGVNRVRGIVFGVIPAYQNLGLETGMIIKFYEEMKKNHPQYTQAELSWIGDFNPKMHSLFEALGAKTTKIHYTYRYNFKG